MTIEPFSTEAFRLGQEYFLAVQRFEHTQACFEALLDAGLRFEAEEFAPLLQAAQAEMMRLHPFAIEVYEKEVNLSTKKGN
jgi:hypothetical protein